MICILFRLSVWQSSQAEFKWKDGGLLPVSNEDIRTPMWQGNHIKEHLSGENDVECMKEAIENVTIWNKINRITSKCRWKVL